MMERRRTRSTDEKDARRMLEMVGELHRRGFESLFLVPGMSASGGYWRYRIGVMRDGRWSNEPEYFGEDYEIVSGSLGDACEIPWEQEGMTLSELTENFIATYADKLEKARVPNPAYVDWFREMLEKTAPDGHFLLYDEMEYYEQAFSWQIPRNFKMPMPPGFVLADLDETFD